YVWKKNEYLDCNWENLVAVSNRPDLYDSHSIKTEDIKEQGDYLIIIWPYQWFSYTTEDTPNEYSSYVVYGLYDAKTGEQIAIGSKHEDSTCDKCGEEMSRTIAEKISSDIISTLFK
ncbi:MAG: hypothetical protein WC358_09955, partial [Ignavibacteria bacterium]